MLQFSHNKDEVCENSVMVCANRDDKNAINFISHFLTFEGTFAII